VIRPFDDFALEVRERFGQSILKDRPLISAIGEQGRQKQDASVAIREIGGMNNRVDQQTQRINEKMAHPAFDL
jgi:hypothetical protein